MLPWQSHDDLLSMSRPLRVASAPGSFLSSDLARTPQPRSRTSIENKSAGSGLKGVLGVQVLDALRRGSAELNAGSGPEGPVCF